MEFSEYQERTKRTAMYPGLFSADSFKLDWVYPALGLAGETGEILDEFKRVLRDDHFVLSDERRDRLVKELGDCLWYIAQLALQSGLNLDDIARTNLAKLESRLDRKKVHGSGDDR
jgi:NTP pyrophosphatase (non-canonical NTP hydrolase)